MGQTTLPTLPLLLRCFNLACFCLDEPFRPLPAVKFSSINTEDPASKQVNLVLPVQSYFSHVVNFIESATTDASISEFPELKTTIGRPWCFEQQEQRMVGIWTISGRLKSCQSWIFRTNVFAKRVEEVPPLLSKFSSPPVH